MACRGGHSVRARPRENWELQEFVIIRLDMNIRGKLWDTARNLSRELGGDWRHIISRASTSRLLERNGWEASSIRKLFEQSMESRQGFYENDNAEFTFKPHKTST